MISGTTEEFIKNCLKMKLYRDEKNFDIETFKTVLPTVLSVSKKEDHSSFQDTLTSVLHKYVLIKKKVLPYSNDNKTYMTKSLSKAILLGGSKKKNTYNKKLTHKTLNSYKIFASIF